jgi:hypothetical protein
VIGDFDPVRHVGSSALEKSHVVSASPCRLYRATVLNTGASAAYLLIFDSTASIAALEGTAPSRTPIPVAAGQPNGDEWPIRPTQLTAGCILALSSTPATLTLIAGSEGWFDAEVQ